MMRMADKTLLAMLAAVSTIVAARPEIGFAQATCPAPLAGAAKTAGGSACPAGIKPVLYQCEQSLQATLLATRQR